MINFYIAYQHYLASLSGSLEQVHDFKLDYFLMVLIATTGILQIAAAQAGFKGLSLFRKPTVDRIFGLLAIIAGFCFFYGTEDRNVPSLEGSGQFAYYLAGVAAATLLTVVVSSLINFGLRGRLERGDRGLEALKKTNYLRALFSSFWNREDGKS